MERSEAINELAVALAKAQGAMESASKDGLNPAFKARYATLAALWDVARKPLSDNGLSVVQTTAMNEAGIPFLETTLLHVSGQYVSSIMPVLGDLSNPQRFGSALTYARRYALGSMVGITADDSDDDGNAASENAKAPQKQTQVQAPKPPVQPASKTASAPKHEQSHDDDFDNLPSHDDPRPAHKIREWLRHMAEEDVTDDPDKVRGGGWAALRALYPGDEDQRTVIKWAFDRDSRKALTVGEWYALKRWAAIRKMGDDFVPSSRAVKEAPVVLDAAHLPEGTAKMFGEEEQGGS